jgi:hypothetical protein
MIMQGSIDQGTTFSHIGLRFDATASFWVARLTELKTEICVLHPGLGFRGLTNCVTRAVGLQNLVR